MKFSFPFFRLGGGGWKKGEVSSKTTRMDCTHYIHTQEDTFSDFPDFWKVEMFIRLRKQDLQLTVEKYLNFN